MWTFFGVRISIECWHAKHADILAAIFMVLKDAFLFLEAREAV